MKLSYFYLLRKYVNSTNVLVKVESEHSKFCKKQNGCECCKYYNSNDCLLSFIMENEIELQSNKLEEEYENIRNCNKNRY